jgi:hypothetical protein
MIDEFLFDTKRGFCEHFAAAFVYALRCRRRTGACGGRLPGRRSQPGRWLPGGATVRCPCLDRGLDRRSRLGAHRSDGDLRPSRINSNLAAAVPAGEELPFLVRTDLSWLRELRHRLDAVTNGWNQWVLGYNPQKQRDFLPASALANPTGAA